MTACLLGLAACGGGDDNDKGFTTGPANPSAGGNKNAVGVGSRPESQRTTFLLSKAADGGFPNGPSRNASVSHDQRIARYIAYESDATNIVDGDTNGKTDVFLVFRAQPFGSNGTPWVTAGTQLISKGTGGQPSNGASYRPELDGDSHHTPHCVAFVSEASNLVPGDTNGKPDGFVYDIRSKRLTRVTVNSGGGQANGATYDISIDGACERVAFTSDATNLALTKAKKAAWITARTTSVRKGTRQVYVHVLSGKGLDKDFKGLTFLASAANNRKAGNGNSGEASIARSGKSVVFSSTATNLAKGDRSGGSDIYRRTIFRKFAHVGGKGVQTLQGIVNLVSATGSGRAGNGPSSHPSITDDGRYVAYETTATDLLPGDSNGVSDIVRADLRTSRPKQEWVSKTAIGGIGNGDSHNPTISDAGEFILFDSEATNLRPSESVKPDPNGVRDVFLWNAPTRNVSLESRDAENGYLNSPSQHPATSSRGNYVPFETSNLLVDLPLASRLFPRVIEQPDLLPPDILQPLSDPKLTAPELLQGVLARASANEADVRAANVEDTAKAAVNAGQQVYMRYLGAK
jgi:Tol biopolymer transport system component